MSYADLVLRAIGRAPLRFWCDCAIGSASEVTEHTIAAQVRTDQPRVGELLSITVICSDCGEKRVLE